MTSAKWQPAKFYTAMVCTFPEGSETIVKIHYHDAKIRVRDLLNTVAEVLGIQESNVKYFALFQGLRNPIKKLEEDEELSLPYKELLSIQKWSFDVEEEKRLAKSDTGALKLLRRQAMSDIQDGRLEPNSEEMALLGDYSSTNFPVDKQYMDVIHSLPDYGTIFVTNCKFETDFSMFKATFLKGTEVTVQAKKQGLFLKSDKQCLLVLWKIVHNLNMAGRKDGLQYEIRHSSHVFTWLRLESVQADYLMAVTREFMRRSLKEAHVKQPTRTSELKAAEETDRLRMRGAKCFLFGNSLKSRLISNGQLVEFDKF